MKTVLVVDDESLFTESLALGLPALNPGLRILTAGNGLEARTVLESEEIDLVLTDLRMPLLDGFELCAYVTRHHSHVPVLVATAFGAPDVGARLRGLGIDAFIEKPVDLTVLVHKIESAISRSASGFVRGIALPTFVQMLEIERKTCIVTVEADGLSGTLQFVEGELWDANAGELEGKEAAGAIFGWKEPTIAVRVGPRPQAPRIRMELRHLLLESMRLHDEEASPLRKGRARQEDPAARRRLEAERLALERMVELTSIDGFSFAGIFSPDGEKLALVSSGEGSPQRAGVLANELLVAAKRVAEPLGSPAVQQVHLEAPPLHVLARCHDEGSGPGWTHLHAVLAITSEASLPEARLRLAWLAESVAGDFKR